MFLKTKVLNRLVTCKNAALAALALAVVASTPAQAAFDTYVRKAHGAATNHIHNHIPNTPKKH